MNNMKENTFHIIHEGSKTGHPGMIYWKSEESNLYLAITTGSSEFNDAHFIKLKRPIRNDVKNSFVNKKPILAKRKDINPTELRDMTFHSEDFDIIIKIKQNEPRYSTSINRKDKRKFRIIKP